MVKTANDHDLRIKQLLYPVAYEIINSLHVQFVSQAFLHTIDHCQFSRALFGFFKQTRCFVKQSRIFKSYTHAIRQRSKKIDIGIRKCIFLVEVLQTNCTSYLTTCDHWHHYQRFGSLAHDNFLIVFRPLLVKILVDKKWFCGINYIFSETRQRSWPQ